MVRKFVFSILLAVSIFSFISCFSDGGDDGSGVTDSSDSTTDTTIETTMPYVIVDTGQTSCYDDSGIVVPCGEAFSWQDADYDGPQPSYQDNSDGTITDLNTGLMWQQDPGDKMTWDEAAAGAASFDLAGYTDWRLPTIKELYSLILFSGLDPSGMEGGDTSDLVPFIDTEYFAFEYGDESTGERIIDSQFTTSTKYVSTTMNGAETVFGVNFADGRIKGYPTGPMPGQTSGKTFFVLYVRGNTDYGMNDFSDNNDGTVSDQATGLMWQQSDSAPAYNWEEACSYCEALELAEYDDWRLPNAKELQGIVDYSRSPATTGSAAIDPIFSATSIIDEGDETNYPFYWTNTTHANEFFGMNASYIAFGEALGWMQSPFGDYTLMDVHGAGAQRSDPKIGDPDDYPYGHGPQGDVIRVFNYARCVRSGLSVQ